MKKIDLIYKDEEYEIYKKFAGDLGSFMPGNCLDLIDIAINGLEEWENAGLAHKSDYEEIIEKMVTRLRALPKEPTDGVLSPFKIQK